MKPFYLNLYTEMKNKGETYVDLSRLLGVHYETIRRKMYGINDWTLDEVETLCMHYDKDLWYLFKDRTKAA